MPKRGRCRHHWLIGDERHERRGDGQGVVVSPATCLHCGRATVFENPVTAERTSNNAIFAQVREPHAGLSWRVH